MGNDDAGPEAIRRFSVLTRAARAILLWGPKD